MRILVVEDERKVAEMVARGLRAERCAIDVASSGDAGWAMANTYDYDLVILDLMLPGMNGFDVLRELRAKSTVPVLMLTGRGEESDRIVGLELGADDYLPKTFSTRELLARLRAVIRRSHIARLQEEPRAPQVAVGDLHLDPEGRAAALGDQPLQLTAVEFDLLLSLAKAAGRVKTREQLLLEVADRNFDVFDRSIDVHISSLRRKLRDDPKSPRFIITVRSAGYMMRKPGMEALP